MRMNKAVVVKTNDPKNRETTLYMEGPVDVCATISPKFVRFSGPAGQKMIQKVTIAPNPKYPFRIKGTRQVPLNTSQFRHALEKTPNGWVLTIENLWPSKGGYFGSIYLDTDSKTCQSLRVEVQGDIFFPAVKQLPVSPPQGK